VLMLYGENSNRFYEVMKEEIIIDYLMPSGF